jgi:hypothetical protein
MLLLWSGLALCLLIIVGTYCALLLQRQRQVEADYQRLLNTANEGIWIIDAAGQTTYVNQRLAELFGYTVEEMLGRSLFELTDEKVRSEIQQHLETSYLGIKQQYFSFCHRDGSTLWACTSTTPRLTSRGTFIGTLLMLTDVTEYRQTQEELQSLQNDLEQQVQAMDTILSTSPDHYYMFDRDGQFLYASRAGLQALGLHKSDIVGKTEQELGFPEELIKEHKQRRETVFSTGETLRGETSVPTVEGVRYHQYSLIPIPDASGNVQVVVAISTDVTERKQEEEELRQYRNQLEELVARRTTQLVTTNQQLNQEIVERQRTEETLREREERLRQIFAQAPIGIALASCDGQLMQVNQAFCQMLGYTKAELTALNFVAITHPEDLVDELPYLEQIRNGEISTYQLEKRYLKKNGEIFLAHLFAGSVRDQQGQLMYGIGMIKDITESKHAKQELQRQTQYRQLLAEITLRIRESLQIEVILQTAVTELQKLLEADRVLFYRLLPNCPGKVVAEAVVPGLPSLLGRELMDHCLGDEFLRQYQQAIHAWPDVEQAGFQPCHLDMLRQFRIRANLVVPILLRDKLWGLLFVHQCFVPRQWNQFEIDLLQQLADQLSIALAQAELLEQEICYAQELARSNAELEQFAYVASHDLQEPLRTLASYAKLLSRRYSGQLDDKANRFIQYIMEEALRMQALINDLLKYSRVGRQAQNFAPCDTRAVFDIVVRRLEEAIANSDAQVTCSDLPTVIADETQLVQLFQNLISNAIKYRSQEPPVIQVTAQRQDGQWLFSVCDNGIGIDPKYAERIFVIFQRLHTQEEYAGTGIGLTIAAKIVERHAGRIWVESELGQGATFYFTIPEQGIASFSVRSIPVE